MDEHLFYIATKGFVMSLSCQLLQTFSKILWSLKSLFIIAILNGEGKILQSRFDCSILRVVFSVQTLYIVPYLALHQHDKTFKGYEGYKGYNVKWNIMQYILWVFHFSNKYWLFWVDRFKSSFFFSFTHRQLLLCLPAKNTLTPTLPMKFMNSMIYTKTCKKTIEKWMHESSACNKRLETLHML